LATTAALLADQLRERVGPVVGQATENAIEWAKPRVGHGIEVAAPKLESAVNGLAPRVDTARDKIVDELIPRIAEAISAWAAASSAAKDEAVSRGQGAAAVISGNAVASPKGRKRRALLILGLLGGAAAAAMAVMRKSAPKDDPWTTPLADTYGTAPNGRHSASSPLDTASTMAANEPAPTVGDSLSDAVSPSPKDPAPDKPTPHKTESSTESDKNVGDSDSTHTKAGTESAKDKASTHRNVASKNSSERNGTDKDPLA
jgi:hypothetical protein